MSDPEKLIKRNRSANRLYHQAGQLKVCSTQVTRFMLKTVSNIGISKDVISCFNVLYYLVKQTDSYPAGFEFRIKTDSGVYDIDGNGNVKSKLDILNDKVWNKTDTDFKNEILLNGLQCVDEIPFSRFLKSLSIGRISTKVFKSFCEVPPYLDEMWDFNRLRSFYAEYANIRWLSPVDDIIRINNKIRSIPGCRKIAAEILDSMCNAGLLGFCPTQYCRRFIIPQLDKHLRDIKIFKRNISIIPDSFRYIKDNLPKGGDGSASNLFTLKHFLKPLAAPVSKLYSEAFYDSESFSIHDLFFTLSKKWAVLFSGDKPYVKEILRDYIDVYIEGIVKLEIPKEILKQLSKILDHIAFIASIIKKPIQLRQFLKHLHAKGIKVLLKETERTGHYANFLKIMKKHFEIVELYGRQGFKSDYKRYLIFFSQGNIHKADDIDDFFEFNNRLGLIKDNDIDTIIENLSEFLKDSNEREQLLNFIRKSPVFDRNIYIKYRKLKSIDQSELLDEIKYFYSEYLKNPAVEIKSAVIPEIDNQIESAIIKQHVKSSLITKRDIDRVLRSHFITGEDKVPKELLVPEKLHVKVRNRPGIAEKEDNLKNNKIRFLENKTVLLNRIFNHIEEKDHKISVLNILVQKGVEFYRGLKQQTETVLQKDSENSKKLNGLNKQLFLPEQFVQLIHRGSSLDTDHRILLYEFAVNLLCTDKKFGKKNSDLFSEFLISGLLTQGDENRILSKPYSVIFSMDENPDCYQIYHIEALREIFSSRCYQYFIDLFTEKLNLLSPVNRNILFQAYKDQDLSGAVKSGFTLADYSYNSFLSVSSYGMFDLEISFLERQYKKKKQNIRKELLISGGKRKIDQFFGQVGELCISKFYKEISRVDMVPIRIVDLSELILVGYIHLFFTRVHLNNKLYKVVMLGGIEPKSSWLSHINEFDFYFQIKKAIIKKTKELGADILAFTSNPVAHSNCRKLIPVITADLSGKPTLNADKEISFPSGIYEISKMTVLWTNGNIPI